jgi:hypothetical protein
VWNVPLNFQQVKEFAQDVITLETGLFQAPTHVFAGLDSSLTMDSVFHVAKVATTAHPIKFVQSALKEQLTIPMEPAAADWEHIWIILTMS